VTLEPEMPPPRSEEAADPVRGAYRLMFDSTFGPFFWGKVLSSTGVWIHNVVAAIVAFEITSSALIVGLVSVAQFMPQLLLAPLSGKMADRGNAALQIVVGRFLIGAGSGGLALWITVAGGVQELTTATPVLVSSLTVGLGFVVGGPAMQSIVPTMIRRGEMAAAMSLNSVPMTLGRAAGPAMGALAATQLGPAMAFAIAATVNVAYGFTVLALRLPRGSTHSSDTDFSVRASLRHLRSDRPLLLLLLAIAAVGLGAEPSITLAPALAADLGEGPRVVGWLASSFGIGAAVGFCLFAPLHRRSSLSRLTNCGLVLIALGLVGAAATGTTGTALASFGVAGLGMTLAFTSVTTLIQEWTPDEQRGRIMSLWFVGFLGTRPFAAGVGGYVADTYSVDLALCVIAGIVLLVAYVSRPRRLQR
jgi:MFS family permease